MYIYIQCNYYISSLTSEWLYLCCHYQHVQTQQTCLYIFYHTNTSNQVRDYLCFPIPLNDIL